MKRSRLNFIIDALGFAAFFVLLTTGVLVRYVLPPGSGHHTLVWGLDRHEWGDLHFWVSVVFLAVMTLHLFLHWRWIVSMLRGKPSEASGFRLALGAIGAAALIALALAPLGSEVERTRSAPPEGTPAPTTLHDDEPIRGRSTLDEIEAECRVPADYLIERLGLPEDVSRQTGISKLGREYGFDIDDVRRIAADYLDE